MKRKIAWKRWNAVTRQLTCTRVESILCQNNNTLPCQGCSVDGWSVEAQRVGSQSVFDITVQPLVQRPGSADRNHRKRICCPLWLPEHECRCPSPHRPTVVVIQIRGSDKSEPYERLLVKQVWNAPKQGIVRTRTIHTCCLQIGTIIWRCWNLHWQTSESNNPSQENRCLLRACSTVSPLNSAAPQAELMWGRLQCWVMEEKNIQLKILHICSAMTLTCMAD